MRRKRYVQIALSVMNQVSSASPENEFAWDK